MSPVHRLPNIYKVRERAHETIRCHAYFEKNGEDTYTHLPRYLNTQTTCER